MKQSKIKTGSIVSSSLIGLFVVLMIAISVLPFLWVLFSSFKTNSAILSGSLGLSGELKWQNYSKAFSIAPLAQFYKNSILIGILGTGLNLVLVSMAGYVVARFSFKGKNAIKLLFTSVLFIPCAALLHPLYLTVNIFGLYDKIMGLVIVYAGLGLATTFYITMSYYLTIPRAIEEAAYLDGASFLKTFISIILPMSKPCFATAGVLQFLLCWNEFQFALTLTTGNTARTLPIALYYFTSQFASDYGAMFAATVLISLPSILVYIALQEQVVSGLASGAVKG